MQYISNIGFGTGHYPNAFDVFVQLGILALVVSNIAMFVVQLNRERFGMPKATRLAITGLAAGVLTLVLHSAVISSPVIGALGIVALSRIHVWQRRQLLLVDSTIAYPYQALSWVNIGIVCAMISTVVAKSVGLA